MSRTYKDKKTNYFTALEELIETCPKILIISVDFVRSLQMQNVRAALRGKATILMGKNTMIRTCLRSLCTKRPDLNLEALVEAVNGNIGFCFVHTDIAEIRKVLDENKMPAAAKFGVISAKDVTLPAGPTGLDPSQTNFFQALNIPTKIVKGTIELVSEVTLCKVGAKVSASEAVLLGKLNIKPFEYGIVLVSVYDNGSVYDAAVLDITDDVVSAKFLAGVQNIAAISREIGVPTEASLPHAVTNAVKNMAALCADIDVTFPEIQKLKDFLADPSAFASAAPAAAAGGAAPAAAAAAAPAEEEEEEEMDFDLFG